MILVEYLNKLTHDGTIDKLCGAGVVSYNYIMYRDIYNHRQALLQQGYKRTESVYMMSVMFKLDYSTIYRAIKAMEQPI